MWGGGGGGGVNLEKAFGLVSSSHIQSVWFPLHAYIHSIPLVSIPYIAFILYIWYPSAPCESSTISNQQANSKSRKEKINHIYSNTLGQSGRNALYLEYCIP